MENEINTSSSEVQQAVDSALKEQKKKKRKKRLIIIFIIAIIVIIGIVIASSGGSDENKTPVMTITADELISDYKNNELSADDTYKDKYVAVTECTVTNINDGFFYVNAKDEDLWLEQIVVYYSDEQKSVVAGLSEEDIVTVTGKVAGTNAFSDVKITDAVIQVNE